MEKNKDITEEKNKEFEKLEIEDGIYLILNNELRYRIFNYLYSIYFYNNLSGFHRHAIYKKFKNYYTNVYYHLKYFEDLNLIKTINGNNKKDFVLLIKNKDKWEKIKKGLENQDEV